MQDIQSSGGMPINQVNAVLPDKLTMRIGIPHRGGRLAVHAFDHDYPAMVSANAFFDYKTATFKVPEFTDLDMLDYALDSAGFTAVLNFQKKGPQQGIAGVFPWTYAQYVELAMLLRPRWWSAPDLCCEPAVAGSQIEIDYRVNATATLLEGTLRVIHSWQEELAKTEDARTIANMLFPCTPILQGWSVSDYLRSLDLLQAVWSRWEPWLAPPTLIGLGSVCRRDLRHPTHGLFAILAALEGRLPKGSRLHLFGVKGACLKEIRTMDWIASADSMAYDYGARIQAYKAGISNTYDHRSKAMTSWMSNAAKQMKPTSGDQFRLCFN